MMRLVDTLGKRLWFPPQACRGCGLTRGGSSMIEIGWKTDLGAAHPSSQAIPAGPGRR